MKTTNLISIVLSFIILNCNGISAQSLVQEKEKKAETEIKQIMEKLNVVGLSVVVVQNGKITYDKSFGYIFFGTDSVHNVKLENNNLFRIASISKTFVATAIFQLIEKGALKLDDDCNKYLKFEITNPKYPDIPITIKMLLSHRSSINDSQGYQSFDIINPYKNKNAVLCYNDYAPGADYMYCNYNYNLLGAIIENISGERFDKYIKKYITDPLNLGGNFDVNSLDSTLFVPLYRVNSDKKMHIEKDAYKPYTAQINSYRLGEDTPLLSPAGGMKITATDLARYMIMHMNNGKSNRKKIISRKSENTLRTVVTPKASYALSFREYTWIIPDCKMYGQTGGRFGFKGAMIFCPEKKIGFIVLTNGSTSKVIDGSDIHKEVIVCLYNNLIK